MKIRNGFVSNSSSSSFTITVPKSASQDEIFKVWFENSFNIEENSDNIILSGDVDYNNEDLADTIDDFAKEINAQIEWDC